MNLPIVVILEDARSRVEWFSREFRAVDMRWATTVEDLFTILSSLDASNEASNLSLIILDHDLGDPIDTTNLSSEDPALVMGGTWPLDKNGNNGMHAVDMIARDWNDVPVIVWSINTPRAQEMVCRLQDKGFVAAWHPHLNSRLWTLRAAIASQVSP